MLAATVPLLTPTARLAAVLAVYSPNPGAPLPGTAGTGLHTIMDWVATIGIALIVCGAIGAGVLLAMSAFGHGQARVGALGWVAGGAIVAGSAAAFVGALAG